MENPLKVSLENIIPLTEARDHFSQIVAEVQKDKLYVLTKGGKPAVAIIDVKYLEMISGGQIQKTHIVNEIKKDPTKVGLPPIISHQNAAPTAPSQEKPLEKPASKEPLVQPPVNKPAPKPTAPEPAGFAAPQPKKPEPAGFATPPSKAPEPAGYAAPQPPQPQQVNKQPLTMPEVSEKPQENANTINVQITNDEEELKPKPKVPETMASPDDKSSPAQYAGSGDEPEDMALD